jgi:hypothetical protein
MSLQELMGNYILDDMHAGFVEYTFFTHNVAGQSSFRTSAQGIAYNTCIRRYGHKHRWLAMIDVDEFIVLKTNTSSGVEAGSSDQQGKEKLEQQEDTAAEALEQLLKDAGRSDSSDSGGDIESLGFILPDQQQQQGRESKGVGGQGAGGATSSTKNEEGVQGKALDTFLAEYEGFGGLAINWVTFGSSGHMTKPSGGTLASFTKCLRDDHVVNRHVKLIVNTGYILALEHNPHTARYRFPGKFTVNELRQPIEGPFSIPVSHTRIAMHHYLLKSFEEFQEKVKRGSPDGQGHGKRMDTFLEVDKQASYDCLDGVALSAACCSALWQQQSSSAASGVAPQPKPQ